MDPFIGAGQYAKLKLASYVESGRASVIPAKYFENSEKTLKDNSEVQFDDHRILALARYSGVRILFTSDRDLIQDFTKPRLINKPRGKIYSEQRPENLIACSGSKETKELEIPDSTDDCHAEQSNSPQVVDKLNAQGFRWMLD